MNQINAQCPFRKSTYAVCNLSQLSHVWISSFTSYDNRFCFGKHMLQAKIDLGHVSHLYGYLFKCM
jgi:hypothetical protein